jgi:hypothetical protein
VVDVVDADPATVVIAYLNAHAGLTEALGGEGRISALNEPPYPHLQVLDTPGGSDRDLTWLIAPEITLKAFGDFDGTPGKTKLRRVLYTALQALRDLPSIPTPPGQPVVTGVRFNGTGGWVPEPNGQPCYNARPQLFMHPPQS